MSDPATTSTSLAVSAPRGGVLARMRRWLGRSQVQRAEPVSAKRNMGGTIASALSQWLKPGRYGVYQLLQAGQQVPWLYANTTKISQLVASTHLRVCAVYEGKNPSPARASEYRAQRRAIASLPSAMQPARLRALRSTMKRQNLQVVELPNHPMQKLLDRPNPMLSGYQARELTQRYLDLVGECFWALERPAPGALPTSFYPVPAHWVRSAPTPTEPTWLITFRVSTRRLAARDMLWLRHPDLTDPYDRGTGAGFALGDEVETDEYAAKTAKAAFFNNGMPSGIVGVESAGDDGLEELSEAWKERHGGPLNAFRLAFVNAKLSFQKLTADFVDMGIVDLRKSLRDVFRGIYGTPPELLGILENSNKATITAAQYLMAVNVLVPRLEWLCDQLEHLLVPQFGEESGALVIDYDSPVPEDRDFRLNAMKAQPSAYTVNEWRDLAGAPPIEGGDALAKPPPAPKPPEDPASDPTAPSGASSPTP